jgi:hypothetical protein
MCGGVKDKAALQPGCTSSQALKRLHFLFSSSILHSQVPKCTSTHAAHSCAHIHTRVCTLTQHTLAHVHTCTHMTTQCIHTHTHTLHTCTYFFWDIFSIWEVVTSLSAAAVPTSSGGAQPFWSLCGEAMQHFCPTGKGTELNWQLCCGTLSSAYHDPA